MQPKELKSGRKERNVYFLARSGAVIIHAKNSDSPVRTSTTNLFHNGTWQHKRIFQRSLTNPRLRCTRSRQTPWLDSVSSALVLPEQPPWRPRSVCIHQAASIALSLAPSYREGTNLDCIDKSTYEIRQDDTEVITSIEDLVEELPDNSARYILLSYPMKTEDGRLKNPFVMLYWRPPTVGQESKMLYAGAVEIFREKSGVAKYV